jgi:hypothetical protein
VSDWRQLLSEVSDLESPTGLRSRILAAASPVKRKGRRFRFRGAWVLSIGGLVAFVAGLALAAHSRQDDRARPTSTGFQAKALVMPSASIGGVTIGERRVEVERLTGEGSHVRTNQFGAVYVSYDAYGLDVIYIRGVKNNGEISNEPVVVQIRTTSPHFRTRSGIGVGSSLSQLKQVAPTVCYPGKAINAYTCRVGTRTNSYPETFFDLTDRRIVAIRLVAIVASDGGLLPPNPTLTKAG